MNLLEQINSNVMLSNKEIMQLFLESYEMEPKERIFRNRLQQYSHINAKRFSVLTDSLQLREFQRQMNYFATIDDHQLQAITPQDTYYYLAKNFLVFYQTTYFQDALYRSSTIDPIKFHRLERSLLMGDSLEQVFFDRNNLSILATMYLMGLQYEEYMHQEIKMSLIESGHLSKEEEIIKHPKDKATKEKMRLFSKPENIFLWSLQDAIGHKPEQMQIVALSLAGHVQRERPEKTESTIIRKLKKPSNKPVYQKVYMP